VLVVEHEAGAPAAWMGERLTELDLALEVCRPYAGDAVPEKPSDADGLLVLGGSMDAWDDANFPWLPDTRALVRAAESTGVPVLGICLGHQLAASALGGEVGRNPAGTTVAVLPIGWGEEAEDDPLLGPVRGATSAVHWNNDVVLALPAGARPLARTPDGEVQAARLGHHVWGVQFHPEAGVAVLEEWVAELGEASPDRSAALEAFLAGARRTEPELAETCARLAASFAALVEGRRR
jgi:GMP synthase (glutamine-hydrolysing)